MFKKLKQTPGRQRVKKDRMPQGRKQANNNNSHTFKSSENVESHNLGEIEELNLLRLNFISFLHNNCVVAARNIIERILSNEAFTELLTFEDFYHYFLLLESQGENTLALSLVERFLTISDLNHVQLIYIKFLKLRLFISNEDFVYSESLCKDILSNFENDDELKTSSLSSANLPREYEVAPLELTDMKIIVNEYHQFCGVKTGQCPISININNIKLGLKTSSAKHPFICEILCKALEQFESEKYYDCINLINEFERTSSARPRWLAEYKAICYHELKETTKLLNLYNMVKKEIPKSAQSLYIQGLYEQADSQNENSRKSYLYSSLFEKIF